MSASDKGSYSFIAVAAGVVVFAASGPESGISLYHLRLTAVGVLRRFETFVEITRN